VIVESLDFKGMAKFTQDLSLAEEIYRMQNETLLSNGVEEETCHLRQSAVVSKSYVPGHPHAFMERTESAEGHDSGWYIGVWSDPLPMDSANSFSLRSLYELSMADQRVLPFWLMPVGTVVTLGAGPNNSSKPTPLRGAA
jgi:hypothetical protein